MGLWSLFRIHTLGYIESSCRKVITKLFSDDAHLAGGEEKVCVCVCVCVCVSVLVLRRASVDSIYLVAAGM